MSIQTDARRVQAEPRPAVHDSRPVRHREPRPAPRPAPVPPGRVPEGWYPACRAAWEFAAALALLVLAAPVILVAALLVKLTSRGPAFYTQTRVGRNGRPFTIYKLRTMVHNCESLTGPRWAMPGDPRVTAVGRFLRKTHLDELPQLLNVLRGDMGLLGPRPERPELIPELQRALPRYWERLTVRPGLTGLAQVQLPPDTDLESVRKKLACDLFYIQHLSAWLDLRILVCTALYVLGLSSASARRLLKVPTCAAVERAVPVAFAESGNGRVKKSA